MIDVSWASYILEAESILFSCGQGGSCPQDLMREAVIAAPELAKEYLYIPSVQEAVTND